MENIAKRLNAYITATPLTPVTAIVKLSSINCTKPTQNPTKVILLKSAMDSKNGKNISAASLWKITTPSSTSAAAYAQLMSIKPLSMDCNTVPI